MTLKEIHAMFVLGSTWAAVNTRVAGACGPRTVSEIFTKQIVFKQPGDDTRRWLTLPKASEVIEARPGYLKFKLVQAGWPEDTVELQLVN